MFQYEVKKLFIKQRAWIIVIVFAAIKLIASAYTAYAPDDSAKMNAADLSQYEKYLQVMKGALTQDKEDYLLAEYEQILDAEAEAETLIIALRSMQFDDRTYFSERMTLLSPILEKRTAFDRIYEQYWYAKDDWDNRYILQESPPFITDDAVDIWLIAPLLLIIIFLMLWEESTNMISLLKTTPNGKSKTLSAKLSLLALVPLSISLLYMLMELGILLSVCHADTLAAPIQSLQFFSGSLNSLSIIQVFLSAHIFKLLGCIFISFFIAALVALFKSPIFPAFIPLSILVLQQFAFSTSMFTYYLPPGLLRPAGYWRGDVYETINPGTELESTQQIMHYIPYLHTTAVVIGTALLIIVCGIIVSVRYRPFRLKPNRGLAVLASLLILLTSCSNYSEEAKASIVSINADESVFAAQSEDRYFVITDGNIVSTDKEVMDSETVIRNPFFSDKEAGSIRGLHCAGNKLYYLMVYGVINEVRAISLDNYSETVVFMQDLNYKARFLGSMRYAKDYGIDRIASFFVYEDLLYLSDYSGVFCYNMSNDKMQNIISEEIYGNNLCFDGETIYYINLQLQLIAHNTASGERGVLSDDIVTTIHLHENKLFYCGTDGVYSMNTDGSNTHKLSDSCAYKITTDGKNVFLLDDKDKGIVRIDAQGLETVVSDAFGMIVWLRGTKKLCHRAYIDSKYVADIISYE